MSKIYSPRIVTDSLVMCLDASQNKSYPTTDLPVKGGLVMWMDAADDATFSYSSGTTVSQWRDKSGYNYHMTPVTAGPTRNAFLNSRKVLAFTTSQNIVSLSFTMETSANTIFVVSRLTGTTNARVLTAYYNNWLLGHWGGLVNPYYAEGWVYYSSNSADTVWRIHMGDWGGSSNNLAATYSNGTVLTNGSTAAAAGPKGLGINISGTEQSTCEVSEIVVFNRVLSTAERRLVDTYLGQKWGISNTDRSIIDLSGNGINPEMSNTIFSPYNCGVIDFNGKAIGTNAVSVMKTTTSLIDRADGQEITVSCWIKPLRTSGQYSVFCTNRSDNDAIYNWIFYQHTNDGAISFHGDNQNKSSYVPTVNQWVNVVATVTGAGLLTLYINGASNYTVSGYTYGNGTPSRLGIGADPSSAEGFQGSMGQTLIYNRALSAAEVAQNYEAQKSKFANTIVQQGLVLNLDAGNPYSYAGAGTTWIDVSGNNNTSLLVGTTLPTFSNTNGGILIYDGDTQYSRTPSPSNNFAWTPSGVGLNNMTIDLWIKTTDGSGTILSKPWSGNGEYNFGLGHQGFSIVIGNQTNTLGFSSILTGNWINLVIVVSPTQYGAYINGVQNTALTNHGITNNTPTYGNGQIELTLMTLYPYGGGGNAGFSTQGNIGSFRIYNRVLSASEVLQNYNATKGRFGL
jgi:hypothetical protein